MASRVGKPDGNSDTARPLDESQTLYFSTTDIDTNTVAKDQLNQEEPPNMRSSRDSGESKNEYEYTKENSESCNCNKVVADCCRGFFSWGKKNKTHNE